MNELGDRIAKYRNERCLSQLEMSDLLDVSRQSISKWETGAAVPELSKIVKMAELFEVDLNELVLGKKTVTAPDEGGAVIVEVPARRTLSVPRGLGMGASLLGIGAAVLALYSYAFNGFDTEHLMHFLPFLLCALCPICRIFSEKIGDYILGALFSAIGWGIGNAIMLDSTSLYAMRFAIVYLIPYVICGVFCFLRLRNAPIWSASIWLSFYAGFLFLNSGATPNILTNPMTIVKGTLKSALTSWVLLALVVLFTALIVYVYKDKIFVFSKRKNIHIALIGALTLVIKPILWSIYPTVYMRMTGCEREYFYATFTRFHEVPRYLIDLALTVIVISCLVPTFYWIKGMRKK